LQAPNTTAKKIVINNKIIEQINTSNYLDCSISYQNENDFTLKISKFLQIMGIIHRILKPSYIHKCTRLKIYNTLAVPTALYRCENLAIKEQDKYRVISVEMDFMRTAKYTWQRLPNQ